MPYRNPIVQAKWKRQRRRELLKEMQLLKGGPCTDCKGRFHPAAMDWDHVRGSKIGNLSKMSTYQMARKLKEIEKCELVCANCHRIRTYNRAVASVPEEELPLFE